MDDGVTLEEIKFLFKKCESVLKLYEEGVPLKDIWNEEDTVRLIKAYREVWYGWGS